MRLPEHKTKIVCTLGPASSDVETIKKLILAGMGIARINMSHGDFDSHRRLVRTLREAAGMLNARVTILADLPGPKIRIGLLSQEPFDLEPGDHITLTTEDIVGNPSRVSVSFEGLPRAVKPGDTIFANDGIIQLEVEAVASADVSCRVIVGGELRSRKGLNLPNIDVGVTAFTENDRRCLAFAMEEHVEAISQSFVESASDITDVRKAAEALGHKPFIVAKIERARALQRIDEIIEAADGIMIARGDLGVEVPIERIALLQKEITKKANRACKPVITATQMLESMTTNPRPTRAEATDVANAILDGTDSVMLSEESATGRYPVEAVSMLSKVARAVEPFNHGHGQTRSQGLKDVSHDMPIGNLLSLAAETIVENQEVAIVMIPTRGGSTARSLTRARLPVWIAAVSPSETTCHGLQFSYGVYPVLEAALPSDWTNYARDWARDRDVAGRLALLIEGPSPGDPDTNHRIEIIGLKPAASGQPG